MKYSQTTQSFGIFHIASSLKFVLLCTLQRVYHKNVFNAKEKAYIFIFFKHNTCGFFQIVILCSY